MLDQNQYQARRSPKCLSGVNPAANMNSKGEGYELFPHGADVGIRGWGPSLNDAFAQGAIAVTSAVTDPKGVRQLTSVKIVCSAPDMIVLFVDWINAIILEMDVRGMMFARFDVVLSGQSLNATIWGEPVDRVRHEPAADPKGATYTMADVSESADGVWTAQCVVDV
jgi:tRNA nucleotidyltransferase (CCA-adding enzyme)